MCVLSAMPPRVTGACGARDAGGVARLARENGWMRCGRCLVYVMLEHGCNHMTCVCGHHFCYACGAPWDQTLRRCLAGAAELRAGLRRELRPAEVAEVRLRVVAAMRREEEHGECAHGRRDHVSGNYGRCARCNWTCNCYGFRCADCRRVFCQTCHHHRM